jgi:hypothetical protein
MRAFNFGNILVFSCTPNAIKVYKGAVDVPMAAPDLCIHYVSPNIHTLFFITSLREVMNSSKLFIHCELRLEGENGSAEINICIQG